MKRLSVVTLAVLLIIGCAGIDTPEKQVLSARVSFNQMLREYVSMQDSVSPEQQTRVKKYFQLAAIALDQWEAAVDGGVDYGANREEFLKQKNAIIDEIGDVLGWTQLPVQ